MPSRASLLSLALAVTTTACATSGARPQPFPGSTPPATATPAPVTTTPADPAASAGASTTTPPETTAASPALTPSPASKSDRLMKTALDLQGTRYRLGGDSPDSGFDCSGFVRFVFEQQQVELPRTVAEQFSVGKKVSPDDIREGDLLFFATTAKTATHVGIALGPDRPGEFVHAPDAGGSVRVEHFDTAYWRTKLVGVRRVL